MLQGECLDQGSFLVSQLYSAATTSPQRIVIRGLITLIARPVGINPNPNDIDPNFEWLTLATFQQMKFCNVDAGYVCWIYPGNRLMPLLNIDRTTLLNQTNL